MKTKYNALWLLLPLCFWACQPDMMELDKGETPLELRANTDSLALDMLNPNSNALNFEWTTGTNHGTGASISYVFQLTTDNASYEDGMTYEMGKNATSKTFTHESLNYTLTDSLGIPVGSSVTLKARVTATVHAKGVEPQTAECAPIKITTYQSISKDLYMIGTATTGEWSLDSATPMNTISGTPGGFTWQGRLKAGELKFVVSQKDFLPSYNKGESDYKLVYRDQDSQPDETFEIATPGMYRITLNIITLAIHIEVLDAPEYSELWFVGGHTGWQFQPMRNDLLDPYVFHYNAVLPEGEDETFKIATAANFDETTVYFRPVTDGMGTGTRLTVESWSEADQPGKDYKWSVAPGTYKIKLNLRTKQIDIVPFTPYPAMYMVGEAAPSGWDLGKATAMDGVEGDPYRFTWTGHLNAGEIKFSCDKKDGWNGDWFLATSAGAAPTGNAEQMLFSKGVPAQDNKWNISTAGTYTIELDQLQELVKFTKQ